jgi:hypothetical protein
MVGQSLGNEGRVINLPFTARMVVFDLTGRATVARPEPASDDENSGCRNPGD